MKSLGFSSKKVQNIKFIVIGLFVVTIGLIISCGKLTENSAPTSPVGTSGGSALPTGLESSRGTYTLSLKAVPDTVPADLITYSTLQAKLEDSSGRSVANFTIVFEAELGYIENDPVGPARPTWSTTATGITSQWGTVSMYYYGARKGSDQVQARIDLDRDGNFDLYTTALIMVTEGPGKPGSDVPGILLTAVPAFQTVQADQTGYGKSAIVTLTADVWEETGDEAGAGVRVEFSGAITGYASTDATGRVTFSFDPGLLSIGTHTFTITACVVMRSATYCDPVTVTVVVLPPTPEKLDVKLTPNPAEIEVGVGTSEIVASVLYQSRPLPGAHIQFQVYPAGQATLSSSTGVTDTFGMATVTLTAGATPGTATVYAVVVADLPNGGTAAGNASVDVSIISVPVVPITVIPNPIAIAIDYAGDPVTSPLGILAIITDAFGNRIPGVTATFTIVNMTGCAGIVFDPPKSTSATTNAAGVAEPTMSVTAHTTNNTCSFQLEVVAGPATTVPPIPGTVVAN